jgi:muconolactone delta-isomerase
MTDPHAALTAATERARVREQAEQERAENAKRWAKYWRENAYYLHERALVAQKKAEELEEAVTRMGGEVHPTGAESVCDVAGEVAESAEE